MNSDLNLAQDRQTGDEVGHSPTFWANVVAWGGKCLIVAGGLTLGGVLGLLVAIFAGLIEFAC